MRWISICESPFPLVPSAQGFFFCLSVRRIRGMGDLINSVFGLQRMSARDRQEGELWEFLAR